MAKLHLQAAPPMDDIQDIGAGRFAVTKVP
jgi:hypothetical protein